MNDNRLYVLLKTINENKNLNSLLRFGLSYKEIAEFTEFISTKNLITISESTVVLTESGFAKLEELKVVSSKKKKSEWIEKEAKSKIKNLDPEFVYLPLQDQLFF